MTRTPKVPRTCRRCICAMAAPIAPGDVPVMATRLSAPRVLTIGPAAPVYRVLEQSRNGAIVLRRHEQHRVGLGDLRLEPDHALRQLAFEVLAVEGQIVDRDEM